MYKLYSNLILINFECFRVFVNVYSIVYCIIWKFDSHKFALYRIKLCKTIFYILCIRVVSYLYILFARTQCFRVRVVNFHYYSIEM